MLHFLICRCREDGTHPLNLGARILRGCCRFHNSRLPTSWFLNRCLLNWPPTTRTAQCALKFISLGLTPVLRHCYTYLGMPEKGTRLKSLYLSSSHKTRDLLQIDLKWVGLWCSTNKVKFYTDKTQVLWFYSLRSIPDLREA